MLRALALLFPLALVSGCEALSWGDDARGQLGDGQIGGNRVIPGASAVGIEWLQLRAGWYHTCGIKVDSTLWCWGQNNQGQLGQGYEDIDSAVPLQVGTAADWSAIAPGYRHTCGIRAGGQLWCWGLGTSGELGDGLSTTSFTPVRVGTASDWKEITAGGNRFTCGIRGAGDLYCWGSNSYGQLGLGDYTNRSTPTLLADSPWKGVDAGTFHTCAISALDFLYCWGRNEEGQSSVFSADVNLPSPVASLGGFFEVLQVSAGSLATCARFKRAPLSEDNVRNLVYCFGGGSGTIYGNSVGPGEFVGCENDPCDLGPLPRFRHVDLGVDHVCGIVNGTNEALCWGRSNDGQLGYGVAADRVTPVPVAGGRAWWSISAGRDHTVGLEMPE